MTPTVIGLDVRHLQGFVYPLAQPLGDFLPLRIGALSAASAGGFVEQRLADFPPLLDELEEALVDEVLVDRHAAQSLCLLALTSSSPAEAKGYIKGAIVGHMAGHGKLGAAAGGAVGHHEANKPDPNNSNAQAPSGRK